MSTAAGTAMLTWLPIGLRQMQKLGESTGMVGVAEQLPVGTTATTVRQPQQRGRAVG